MHLIYNMATFLSGSWAQPRQFKGPPSAGQGVPEPAARRARCGTSWERVLPRSFGRARTRRQRFGTQYQAIKNVHMLISDVPSLKPATPKVQFEIPGAGPARRGAAAPGAAGSKAPPLEDAGFGFRLQNRLWGPASFCTDRQACEQLRFPPWELWAVVELPGCPDSCSASL